MWRLMMDRYGRTSFVLAYLIWASGVSVGLGQHLLLDGG